MKKSIAVVGVSIVLFGLLFIGCSSQKAMWGNEKDGFVLTYRLADGEQLSYTSAGIEKTTIEVMGTNHGPTTTFNNDYTVTATKGDDDNLHFTVTIDDFVRQSTSENGDFSVDASPIVTKDFQLVLSPFGKELEFIGIKELEIDLGPGNGGIQDVQNYYRSLFPDLPEQPIKVGDSWTVEEEFDGPAANLDVAVKTKNTHTLLGQKVVDGEDCLEISLLIESTITGTGVQDGMDLELTAAGTGSGTWYFAYKRGVFIKSEGVTHMKGDIDVSGDFAFSMPISQETTTTVQLLN